VASFIFEQQLVTRLNQKHFQARSVELQIPRDLGPADPSWICFSTGAHPDFSVISPTPVLRWERRPGNTPSFLNSDQLVSLNTRKSLNQAVSPVNFQIGMVAGSKPEMKPAIVH
jgi:hypothetical protein